MPELRQGEAGEARLPRRQSVLHQALRFYVGRRCESSTIKAIAQELHLDGHTVKELDQQYLGEQLRRAGKLRPKVVGIDEVSIQKGHTYRIVVSDLERRRAIWFGGKDRSEASMDEFFKLLGPAKSRRIRLAVMDMWKPFRNSTLKRGGFATCREACWFGSGT